MVRDIRELTDSPSAYADELRRRWGGLLSYRYIGRSYASMDLGPEDNTVTIRRDMRDPTGALLLAVLCIAAPEGGHMSDLEAVPNPVIHSCQILDAGRDVQRIEIVSEGLKRGRQMGYSRAKIVDADQPDRVLALKASNGWRPTRSRWSTLPTCLRCGRCSAATADRTATGHCRNWRSRSRPPTPRCTSDRSS
jgi:hypothetical protein